MDGWMSRGRVTPWQKVTRLFVTFRRSLQPNYSHATFSAATTSKALDRPAKRETTRFDFFFHQLSHNHSFAGDILFATRPN